MFEEHVRHVIMTAGNNCRIFFEKLTTS